MLDWIHYLIETIANFLRHGWNLTAFFVSLAALLRVRAVRRKIAKSFPRIMDEESEVKRYMGNQLDIIHNLKRLLAKEGMAWESSSPPPISKQVNGLDLKKRFLSLQTAIRRGNRSRRVMKMKNYLKKLGSRKFQAFMLATVTNLFTLYLMWKGEMEVDQKVAEWGPLINLGVQVVTTAVYVMVEGKVDRARANGEDQSNPGEAYH